MTLPDPEAVASALREKVGQIKPPVDLKAIADQFPRLTVKEIELDGEGLFIDLGDRGAEIYLKINAGPLRKRFTLAHELGHAVLAEFGGQPVGQRKSRKINSAIENWCNTFAANLLMPRQDVLQFLRQGRLSGLISTLSSGPAAFRVSHQAFRVRASEIAPLSIYVFESDTHTCKLKEYFLSHLRDDLRWTEAMNSVVSKMFSNATKRVSIARTAQHTIVGGHSRVRPQQGEFLVVVLPLSSSGLRNHAA